MDEEIPGGGLAEMQLKQAYEERKPSHRESLTAKKMRLEAQLKAVNEALAALDAHPDLEAFIRVLGRAGV